ncbi:MAG: DUF2089 domain-containing protein [Trueperaceae bacterium]|nr:DUF2089 domain-containing protein [Trueperaceae bacterium]
MPKHPMPTRCPVTGETLEVTRLRGPTSGVVIEGEFLPNEFALLDGEALEYLRLFVKVRGNLKEVERMLGVSYPTVRARFDAMVRALGYEVADEGVDARSEVLAALERGEIGAEEATRRLQGMQRRA